MAGSLGPKPRMNMGGGGGVSAPGGMPAFFEAPAGSMQPPGMQPPGQPMGQPMQSAFGQAPGGGGVQAPAGSIGGSMQPGSFPQPGAAPAAAPMQPGIFPAAKAPQPAYNDDDFENEPPLLEELGINVEHIITRMKGVAFFTKVEQEVLEDLDLSGPLAIILALSMCLLLAGKITFSYVYGFGVTGCVLIWGLINLMSQKGGIDVYRTMSVLGYGLIPVVIMAFLGIFVSLQSTFGTVLAGGCIAWSTATASRFFATANSMAQQRWLVAYPVGLFYLCFSLITVF